MLDVIRALKKKRDELLAQAERIGKAIVALGHSTKSAPKKRKISAAARRKMSQAAKARWSKRKSAKAAA